jgi:hypothetical protein
MCQMTARLAISKRSQGGKAVTFGRSRRVLAVGQ